MPLKAPVSHAQAPPVNPRLPLMHPQHVLSLNDYFLFNLIFIKKIIKIMFFFEKKTEIG
jgi:hypothetical protein